MYDAVDPVLQEPTLIPIVWGVICTFHIHIMDKDHLYTVIHHFTVLEYIDEKMYMLEHSFHCHRQNTEDNSHKRSDFYSLCSENNWHRTTNGSYSGDEDNYSNDRNGAPDQSHTSRQKVDQSKAKNKVDQSKSVIQNSKSPSQSDRKRDVDDLNCSKDDCSNKYEDKKYTKDGDEVKYLRKKGHFSVFSYNIWNTNVVEGGDQDYISRIKSLAEVGSVFV